MPVFSLFSFSLCSQMNLVFAGTPDFAVPALKALLDAGHTLLAIYTQPDRPAGRGRKLAMSPVKECALAHGLDVYQPATLKTEKEAETLRALKPDAMIVIAYGLILPPSILAIPKFGCINVHASLLPRWRGAAPIQRAIEAGDDMTGITIMQMDAGLDTGAMLALAATPIHAHDTAASLHDRLAEIGASLLPGTLAKLERGEITPQAQDTTHATYARKLTKDEARLDWSLPADVLARRVRAFNPWPVATTMLEGKPLRVWMAVSAIGPSGTPGTVLAAGYDGIQVHTGQGTLLITTLQTEGGKPLAARDFLNGRKLAPGTQLGP
jgi:methionyl-tRNA formyltransferase